MRLDSQTRYTLTMSYLVYQSRGKSNSYIANRQHNDVVLKASWCRDVTL